MTLSDAIYKGSVLGFGMSGQAGSSFLVLGVLARLKAQAEYEGKKLSVIYAFDRNSSSQIGDLLQRTADQHGIHTVPAHEVSLSEHRKVVDSSSFCWYGDEPDIEPFIQDELALFDEFQPSLLIGFLHPTLAYSRKIYEQRTGLFLPYMGLACSLVAGPGSYGVPANFFPSWLASIAPYLSGESRFRDFIIRQVYQLKISHATNYLYEGFKKCGYSNSVPRQSFSDALFGDLPLILSSPLLSRYRPDNSHLIGLMDIRLCLTEAQERRQDVIIEKLKQWHSQQIKIIFISMGSTGHSFPKVLSALAPMAQDKKNNIRLLISTTVIADGAAELINDLQQNDMLLHSDWMHMDDILPLIDVLVTHGGVNSIESSLRWNVPIVVAAPQQMEQGFNGLAIQSYEVGDVVWTHCIENIRLIMHQVLKKHEYYLNNIQQYKQTCQKCYTDTEQKSALIAACNELMKNNE